MKYNRIILCIMTAFALFTGCMKTSDIKSVYNGENDLNYETTQSTEDEISALYIQLADNYVDDDSLSNLYAERNVIARVKKFNEDLNTNLEYYEMSFQALQSLDYFDGDERFVKTYNRKGGQIKNQEVMIDGKKCYVTSLNTIQVNKRFFDENLLLLEEGKGFDRNDYLVSDFDQVPIILGYQYTDYFNVGDILTLNYLEKNINFYIKGFLQKGIRIEYNNAIVEMDNYICMPSFDCTKIVDQSDDEFLFQMRHYLQKNRGYIKYTTENDRKHIEQELSNYINNSMLNYSLMDTRYQINVRVSNVQNGAFSDRSLNPVAYPQ